MAGTLSGTSSAAWHGASGPHNATYQTYCGDEMRLPSPQHLSAFFVLFSLHLLLSLRRVCGLCGPHVTRATSPFMRAQQSSSFLHYFSTSFCGHICSDLSRAFWCWTRTNKCATPLSIIIINYRHDHYSSCSFQSCSHVGEL